MSRQTWTDPAPLEVERPRLPWWTMLHRKLLLWLSPVILLVVVVTALVFIARRVWRYPLFLIGGTILTGLGIGYSWWAVGGLLAGLTAACGLWAWQHRDSFTRIVLRQVRSEYRRALVYAWPWKRAMLFSGLTKRTGHGPRDVHYPRLRRVRGDGWRDRVSVKLLHGQCADSYAAQAEELANSSAPAAAGFGWIGPAGSGWTSYTPTRWPHPSPCRHWPTRVRRWIWRG